MFLSFLQVMQSFVEGIVSDQILSAIRISLGRLLIGFISASIIGLILGYLIWKYKLIEDTLGFLITALQSIPSIVWFPLAIIWFDCNAVIKKDRKSTRLNSSHVAISYAVFCLKKKMTIH